MQIGKCCWEVINIMDLMGWNNYDGVKLSDCIRKNIECPFYDLRTWVSKVGDFFVQHTVNLNFYSSSFSRVVAATACNNIIA